MNIELSVGEIIDKWTILSIKTDKIKDKSKLKNIFKELSYLNNIIQQDIISDPLVNDLLQINKLLWESEDKIRHLEKNNIFDDEFINTSRSIYKLNDKRFELKKMISVKNLSNFIEEKSFNYL